MDNGLNAIDLIRMFKYLLLKAIFSVEIKKVIGDKSYSGKK
ncbi:hypothetical protein [Paenibacillus tyrfis]|nr:hypothetical protein [Paenibacillus tyrfis]